MRLTSNLARRPIHVLAQLTQDEAAGIKERLDGCKDALALQDLVEDGVMVAQDTAEEETDRGQ